jgi:hypothetical protein
MDMAEESRQREHTELGRLLQDNRTGLILTGRIKDGKLELDQRSLNEIATKFPKADMAFVALNSPFDPISQSL